MLQNALSGELAAFHAYDGHYKSVSDASEKQEIKKIRDEEMEHRKCVAGMLAKMGAKGRPRRELLMKCIGLTIGFLCRIGGWLIPMYGAGKLEAGNIVEYEVAARLAAEAGYAEFVGAPLGMAEIEWNHEFYFRQKYQSHRLQFLLPAWKVPPGRDSIRAKYEAISLRA